MKRAPNRPCPSCRTYMCSDYSSYCKLCANERQKAYMKTTGYKSCKEYQKRLRAIIQESKNKPCADCKTEYPYYVMDFDHRRDKKFNISIATNRRFSVDKIKEEIAKCDVVCANCHRERTFKRI